MRLLIANSHRSIVGGIETYLRALLPALAERGIQAGLLHEFAPPPGDPLVDALVPGLPLIDAAAGIPEALAAARAFRPDVIFQMGLYQLPLEAGLQELAPNVLFAHVYHGGCISGFKRHAFPSQRPCGRDFGPACLGLYFPLRCGGLSPASMWQEYQRQAQRRALLPRYRAVVVASRRMQREYAPAVLPEERVVLAPVFPGVLPDAESPGARARTFRVAMLGRLNPLKGGLVLVRAVALAARALGRPLELCVAGDGPERGEMEALARRLGVPGHFPGWVDDAAREALFRRSDVLAVPSVWPEPFGIVGVEAGCVGLPSVAFAVGGIPDWLEPGVCGELAPASPPTARGLADALVRALSDDAHLQHLRQGAWLAARRFSPEAHLRLLLPALSAAAGLPAALASAS